MRDAVVSLHAVPMFPTMFAVEEAFEIIKPDSRYQQFSYAKHIIHRKLVYLLFFLDSGMRDAQ